MQIEDAEKELEWLCRATAVPLEIVKPFTVFAQKMREGYKEGKILYSPSTTIIKWWIEHASTQGVVISFEMVIVSRFSEKADQTQFLMDLSRELNMNAWVKPNECIQAPKKHALYHLYEEMKEIR